MTDTAERIIARITAAHAEGTQNTVFPSEVSQLSRSLVGRNILLRSNG